jgi:hypothetical protein
VENRVKIKPASLFPYSSQNREACLERFAPQHQRFARSSLKAIWDGKSIYDVQSKAPGFSNAALYIISKNDHKYLLKILGPNIPVDQMIRALSAIKVAAEHHLAPEIRSHHLSI